MFPPPRTAWTLHYVRNTITSVRYPAGHKDQTRRRIVVSAARRFRKRGFASTGVDAVMADAGLTAGGFYSHFRSKGALLSEVVASGLAESRERLLGGLDELRGVPWLQAVVRRYLSRTHRDRPDTGCVLPTLTAEVARQDKAARATFEDDLKRTLAAFRDKAPAGQGLDAEDRLLATLALGAGGVMLARAVADPELSDRILRACRRLAVPEAA